ncbi:MAG: toll/interleukin-1 receptor domain-containing protein [Chloroflexi bacterium]|nr:toll/interleukin-1 receptor domain-containing protein [Chloroflexota bacterium]
MPRIFISYRRDDSAAHSGRIYDRLEGHFGQGQVFMDVDTIRPGLDFVEVVQEAVGSCDALIAVIGREWLGASDDSGGRRLENPEDLVRLEIATALERDIRVIPVLVQETQTPLAADLPEDLKALARRNSVELSDNRFRADIEHLIQALEAPTSERLADSVFVEPTRPSGNRLVSPVGLAVILSAVALGLGVLFLTGVIPTKSQTSSIPESRTFAPLRTVSKPIAPGQSARLASPGGDIAVDISAGAVNTFVRVWYGVVPPEETPQVPSGFRYSGKVFDLSVTGEAARIPDTFSFVKPISISVRFTEADASLAGGVESNVVIQRYDSDEQLWTPLETTVDWAASLAHVQVSRLSSFALTIKEP